MTTTEACDCMYTNVPATIKGLTNAQSYRIVEVFPLGSVVMAKLLACHVDYCGKAVDVNKNDMITADIDTLNRINIEDYDNY